MTDSDIFIISAVRTAIGSGKETGALHPLQPVELTALVMREAIRRAGVDSACLHLCRTPALMRGCGFCLRAGKTRSEENACRRCRRIPTVQCIILALAQDALLGGVYSFKTNLNNKTWTNAEIMTVAIHQITGLDNPFTVTK
jgi:hypothetical protein